MWNISVEPRNQLSDEDFERYTEDRKYCEPDGGMALEGFRQMVVSLILAFRNKTGAWANRKVNRYTGRESGSGSKGYLSMILDAIREPPASTYFSLSFFQENRGFAFLLPPFSCSHSPLFPISLSLPLPLPPTFSFPPNPPFASRPR